MELNEIINLILNYGAMGGCLAYFILKDKRTQEKQIEKQEETNRLINSLQDTISELKMLFEIYIKKEDARNEGHE